MKLLRVGVVSRVMSFISMLDLKRAANAIDLMRLLPYLCDPLKVNSFFYDLDAKFFFGVRTCQPIHMEENTLFFNKQLQWLFDDLVVCKGSFFGDI